mmetsp:Transcript_645/g.2352  ORF Transcript_645/g.2352 Transcript_645/m.2352 type:complete len:415 (+) Transcript_645:1064-2308(+)
MYADVGPSLSHDGTNGVYGVLGPGFQAIRGSADGARGCDSFGGGGVGGGCGGGVANDAARDRGRRPEPCRQPSRAARARGCAADRGLRRGGVALERRERGDVHRRRKGGACVCGGDAREAPEVGDEARDVRQRLLRGDVENELDVVRVVRERRAHRHLPQVALPLLRTAPAPREGARAQVRSARAPPALPFRGVPLHHRLRGGFHREVEAEPEHVGEEHGDVRDDVGGARLERELAAREPVARPQRRREARAHLRLADEEQKAVRREEHAPFAVARERLTRARVRKHVGRLAQLHARKVERADDALPRPHHPLHHLRDTQPALHLPVRLARLGMHPPSHGAEQRLELLRVHSPLASRLSHHLEHLRRRLRVPPCRVASTSLAVRGAARKGGHPELGQQSLEAARHQRRGGGGSR